MNLKPEQIGFVQNYSKFFNIDLNLVLALIEVESGGNQFAVRYEQEYRFTYFPRETASRLGCSYNTELTLQSCSFGPLQIMGANARAMGFAGWLTELCSFDLGVYYACAHLKSLQQQYQTETDVIASYNAGSPRKTEGGMYYSQPYVNKVSTVLNRLRALK